jgi:hypothetical protein
VRGDSMRRNAASIALRYFMAAAGFVGAKP